MGVLRLSVSVAPAPLIGAAMSKTTKAGAPRFQGGTIFLITDA
jgi:hypothetical protein